MNKNFKFPHWCGEDCDCNDENGNECPYLNGDDCLLPNDDVEHGQLVECLNELKMYRNSSYGELYDMAHKAGYNKALDDFIRALDQHCGYYHGKNKILTRNDILKIAENIKNYKKI